MPTLERVEVSSRRNAFAGAGKAGVIGITVQVAEGKKMGVGHRVSRFLQDVLKLPLRQPQKQAKKIEL
jgi:hypothetical protein